MLQKEEALLDIVALAIHHGITLAEITSALNQQAPVKQRSAGFYPSYSVISAAFSCSPALGYIYLNVLG